LKIGDIDSDRMVKRSVCFFPNGIGVSQHVIRETA
jgi:hypothetical protein